MILVQRFGDFLEGLEKIYIAMHYKQPSADIKIKNYKIIFGVPKEPTKHLSFLFYYSWKNFIIRYGSNKAYISGF